MHQGVGGELGAAGRARRGRAPCGGGRRPAGRARRWPRCSRRGRGGPEARGRSRGRRAAPPSPSRRGGPARPWAAGAARPRRACGTRASRWRPSTWGSSTASSTGSSAAGSSGASATSPDGGRGAAARRRLGRGAGDGGLRTVQRRQEPVERAFEERHQTVVRGGRVLEGRGHHRGGPVLEGRGHHRDGLGVAVEGRLVLERDELGLDQPQAGQARDDGLQAIDGEAGRRGQLENEAPAKWPSMTAVSSSESSTGGPWPSASSSMAERSIPAPAAPLLWYLGVGATLACPRPGSSAAP